MIGPDVSPFQGLAYNRLSTQGGAERLTPLRLPWAGMFQPLRGECIQRLRVPSNDRRKTLVITIRTHPTQSQLVREPLHWPCVVAAG
jgi:hypothetical protein